MGFVYAQRGLNGGGYGLIQRARGYIHCFFVGKSLFFFFEVKEEPKFFLVNLEVF